MSDLSGRHAVVTGGGSGIGAAIARRLADAGVRVSLMARGTGRLEELAAALPEARAHALDVADEASVEAAFAAATEAFGPVDILIANAGIAPTAPLAKTTLADWQRVLDVNLTGVFLCVRAVLPAMRAAGHGRIVAIASTAGLKGYPYAGAYSASKHGVIGLVRATALEVARTGITVNAVCPGFVRTDIVEESIERIVAKTGRSHEDALADLVAANPQGRLIEPEEVAAMALWLCGEDAAGVNGAALAISGGEIG